MGNVTNFFPILCKDVSPLSLIAFNFKGGVYRYVVNQSETADMVLKNTTHSKVKFVYDTASKSHTAAARETACDWSVPR